MKMLATNQKICRMAKECCRRKKEKKAAKFKGWKRRKERKDEEKHRNKANRAIQMEHPIIE